MIISLHTPKAGGSSFKRVLKDEFKYSFHTDNKDRPINKSFDTRIKDAENFRKKFKFIIEPYHKLLRVKCIDGHFLPYKYKHYLDRPDVIFVTWLRDPVERLASHYHYWFRSYDKKRSSNLHKKVVENNWSLEKFVFSSEMKNFYHQFLYNFPVDNFDFVGITEYFEEDLNYFAEKYLNKNINSIPKFNTNPNKIGKYIDDPKMKNELKEFHHLDYSIYDHALRKRKNRAE